MPVWAHRIPDPCLERVGARAPMSASRAARSVRRLGLLASRAAHGPWPGVGERQAEGIGRLDGWKDLHGEISPNEPAWRLRVAHARHDFERMVRIAHFVPGREQSDTG